MARGLRVLLFSIHATLLACVGWFTCPNKTEVGHMAAAVYSWRTLRFDVFDVNPPLTRMISGLPVVLCRPNYTFDSYSRRPEDRCEWSMGRSLHRRKQSREDAMVIRRSALVIDSVAGAGRVFRVPSGMRDVRRSGRLRLSGPMVFLPATLSVGRDHLPGRGGCGAGPHGGLRVPQLASPAELDSRGDCRCVLRPAAADKTDLDRRVCLVAACVVRMDRADLLYQPRKAVVDHASPTAISSDTPAWALRAQYGLSVRRNVSPIGQVRVHKPVLWRPARLSEPRSGQRWEIALPARGSEPCRFRCRPISCKASTRSGWTSSVACLPTSAANGRTTVGGTITST